MTVLTVENLTYKRNLKTILTGLNLTLEGNQIVGLLGANGAGKTTLMRLIAGAATSYHGTIAIGDQTKPAERKAIVSFSEQVSGVNDSRKLGQIAQFYNHVYPDFDMDTFKNLAAGLSLDENQRFNQLSKGNHQKFVVAIALSRQAKLYLLDEPFNGIDSMSRKKIVASIIQWKPETATILISDHHVADIANILDAVAVVKDQTVVDQKKADEIRENGQSIEDYYEGFYAEGESDND